MKRRLDASQSVIAPWDIPDITAAQKASLHDFLELEFGQEPQNGELPPKAEAIKSSGNATEHTPETPLEPEDPRSRPEYSRAYQLGLAEGREHGYADGFAAGRQAADSQFANELRRLDSLLRGLGEPMRSLERPVEDAVIALALEVARWVIGGEVARSREYLVRLIRGAVVKIPIDIGTPTILLNPGDIEAIRRLAPDLEYDGVVLASDEEIDVGSCRVIADDGNGVTRKDRRWHPGALRGVCEVDLTLASRWREAMFAMFEGEDT
jgi:flagellar assembly protein FliH